MCQGLDVKTCNDVITSAGSLQVCAGRNGDGEALVYAMHSLYHEKKTEAVLLVDAQNVFNAITLKAILHSNYIICTSIATFVHNCFFKPLHLFVTGGVDTLSSDGTTQGDPLAMAVYAIVIILLIFMTLDITDQYLMEFQKQLHVQMDLQQQVPSKE